jgi:hypothetical protein
MPRIFDGLLDVGYHTAYVESFEHSSEDFESACIGQTNGLLGAAVPGLLCLTTGLHHGAVGLTIDILNTPPPIDDAWEEIVEASFVSTSDTANLVAFYGERVCDIPLPEKHYRVRYCARNMDYGQEVDTIIEEDPIDFYSLIFWPAPSAPDAIIKQTSETAAYWNSCRSETL